MFQSQHNFSDYSHPANPNPTNHLTYPIFVSDPTLLPPGIVSYATPSSWPYIHGGFQVHPAFHQHPNATSQNVVVTQADSIGHASAINSMSETPTVSTILNSLWNNSWMNQHLLNDVTMKTTKPSKGIQSIRCELCKIDCNSKDVFERHVLGKKHRRNLQTQTISTFTLPYTIEKIQNASLGQMISVASGVSVDGELEMKKHKLLETGASVDSVMFCTICNVACNSQSVFDNHLSGRKHTAKANARLLSGLEHSVAANSNPISLTSPTNGMKKHGSNKSKIVQSAWCEVCKISCNSYEVFNKHNLGKKHLKKIEKLKNTNGAPAAPATTPMIGPVENLEASKGKVVGLRKSKRKVTRSQASEEDLETKRRKVMEGGAAEGDVRVCNICNVVCNSPTVFDTHLVGQKHTALMKKQVEAGINTSAAQMVTAA